LREVFKGFPNIFTQAMIESLRRDITSRELSAALMAMAKGKAPRHDIIPIEFFQEL
jgi:hypothetical protein